MTTGNIFTEQPMVLDSISKSQTYPFYNNILTPTEIGIVSDGSKIQNNIELLKQYDDIIISGTVKPMGNKYFVQTGGKCKDISSNETVSRSLYINNVQDASAPFAKNTSGEDIQYKGLIPSIITDIDQINPLKLYQAFTMGTTPNCRLIRLETIDVNGAINTQSSGYISDIDLTTMNECLFPNKINPVTEKICTEHFSNIDVNSNSNMPDDILMKAYLFAVGILGFYIIMKIVTKNNGYN